MHVVMRGELDRMLTMLVITSTKGQLFTQCQHKLLTHTLYSTALTCLCNVELVAKKQEAFNQATAH